MEVLQRTANRGSISTGYEIDNSLKFEVANGEGIWRVTDTTSNRRTFTCSMWFKPTEVLVQNRFLFGSRLNSTNYTYIRHSSTGKLQFRGHPGSGNKILNSVAVFADTSAYYHLVLAVDTTQSTSTNRVKIYINGEQIELTGTYPAQNEDQQINLVNNKTNIGFMQGYYDTTYNFCGYIAEAHFVDGTQYAASDFGEYDSDSGIWIPKQADVTYGSQGFYVNFDDASSLGADSSGNSNTLSLQNITSADQATDTPTNNFAHWNPLMSYDGDEGRAEITEGGTTLTNSNTGNGSSNGWYGGAGTIPVTSGKWYWEYQPFAGTFGYHGVGIMGADYVTDDLDDIRDYGPNLYLRDGATPKIYQHLISGTNTAYKTMTSWTSNSSDIFAIALNMDDEEITFYRNGTAITENGTSNTTFSISSVVAQSSPIIFHYQSYANGTGIYFNFGGYTEMSISSAASDANGYGTFEYAPPSGYYALCGKNLAEYGGTA
jgi:hypothetical protein